MPCYSFLYNAFLFMTIRRESPLPAARRVEAVFFEQLRG